MIQSMDNHAMSLLWPQDSMQSVPSGWSGSTDFVADLEVDVLVGALSMGRKYEKYVRSVLLGLGMNKSVIEYRLDVLEDLLNNPRLVVCFSTLLPLIDELSACRESVGVQATPLLAATKRFGELDLYVQCMDQMADALIPQGEALRSAGLCLLRDRVSAVCQTESFQTLRQSIPSLKSGMDKMASVTIGINLDEQLRPFEATIVSINERRFRGSQLLQTLFSRTTGDANGFTGISELHTMLEPAVRSETQTMKRALLKEDHSLQVMLFQDLQNILNKALAPVISTVKRYTHVSTMMLVQLESEIAFLLGVVRLVEKLREYGLPVCRPAIAEDSQRAFRVLDGYYVNLAIRRMADHPDGQPIDNIVTNDIAFDEGGTIFILTGPNRGGKTTYLQTIGLIQILFQAGCYVPGSYAQISIADQVFTHFPVEEKPGDNSGRLGEEAKRVAEILNQATSGSLVLLNESISSTSPSENLEISRNVVLGLKCIALRAVYATHMHELAGEQEEWETISAQGCGVVSIVAGIDEGHANVKNSGRTYKVVRAKPRGSSFAMDIAQKYGLGREQILHTLSARGIISQG